MARVITQQVKDIFSRSGLTDDQILAHIQQANTFVDLVVLPNNPDELALTEIELNMAAHFAVINEERGGLVSESFGDGISDKYASTSADATGLHMTRYGKQAILLDMSGTLRMLDKRKASIMAFPRTLSRHPDNFTGRG